LVYADNKLVSFGGHYLAGEGKFDYLDETWLLDVEKLVWHKMVCSGQIPGPRYGHSAHIFGSRMFIFGGKGPGGVVYNDVYFLDLIEWIWVPVSSVGSSPSARYAYLIAYINETVLYMYHLSFHSFFIRFFHASEIVGRKIVIHGGWNEDEVLSDMWIFNTDSFAWMQPKTTGFAPSPRYGHSLNLTPDGRLIVFGGCNIAKDTYIPKYLDDLRQLDTDTMIWTRPRTHGIIPTGRYGHSALLMSDGMIVVFGGWGKGGCQCQEALGGQSPARTLHVLDTKTMSWYSPRRLGTKPWKHQFNHGACRSGQSSILTFGGFDGRQATNEFYVMNIDLVQS
jgi:host cell factor